MVNCNRYFIHAYPYNLSSKYTAKTPIAKTKTATVITWNNPLKIYFLLRGLRPIEVILLRTPTVMTLSAIIALTTKTANAAYIRSAETFLPAIAWPNLFKTDGIATLSLTNGFLPGIILT